MIQECAICGGSLVPVVYAWDVTALGTINAASDLKQEYKLYRCSECGIVYSK